jgi:hypothetical protein
VSRERSEDLIARLVEDAQPVRRLAGVGARALAVAVAWALLAAAVFARPLAWERLAAAVAAPGVVSATLLGLLLAAGGGIVAALAGSEPGRETLERWSLVALVLGIVLALGAPAAVLLADPAAEAGPTFSLARDARCVANCLVFGFLPALTALGLAARGVSWHARRAAMAAGAGALALGGIAVQLACTGDPGLRHLLVAHASAPVLGALAALPAARLLARRRSA